MEKHLQNGKLREAEIHVAHLRFGMGSQSRIGLQKDEPEMDAGFQESTTASYLSIKYLDTKVAIGCFSTNR
jgi:hypothetical protein